MCGKNIVIEMFHRQNKMHYIVPFSVPGDLDGQGWEKCWDNRLPPHSTARLWRLVESLWETLKKYTFFSVYLARDEIKSWNKNWNIKLTIATRSDMVTASLLSQWMDKHKNIRKDEITCEGCFVPKNQLLIQETSTCLLNTTCWSYSWRLTPWTSCRPAGSASCGSGSMFRGKQCIR